MKHTKNEVTGRIFDGKTIILTLLALVSLMACLTVAPRTYMQSSKKKPAVKAEPTPPEETLDEEAAGELIAELKESLAEEIEDEDSIAEIVEKWESRELTGQTRKRALKILFADVESVVDDEEITAKVWEKWNSDDVNGDEDSVDVTPLSAETKQKQGQNEETAFKEAIRGIQYTTEEKNYKGQNYTILKDIKDPIIKTKVEAVNKAVRILIDKGLTLPAGLKVYCVNNPPRAIAFKRDANWKQVALVVLGKDVDQPNTDQPSISMTKFGGLDKPTITTIHEIGHILHERFFGDGFWQLDVRRPGERLTYNADKVSVYATRGQKEFVAEVFAGSVIGMKFPAEVMDEYKKLGGPPLSK